MYVNGMDIDRLERGVSTALDMMVDGMLCAVVIVGVQADGRGMKIWTGGDEGVADQVRAQISRGLPYTPSYPPRQRDEEDGA